MRAPAKYSSSWRAASASTLRGTGLDAGSVRTTLIVAKPEHGPQALGGGGECQRPEWCRVARGGEIGV